MDLALGPGHRLCPPLDLEQALVPARALDPGHRPFRLLVQGLDWQRVLEWEQGLQIGQETLCQASEAETWNHDFQIRVPEFRIVWQIARRLLKTGEAA